MREVIVGAVVLFFCLLLFLFVVSFLKKKQSLIEACSVLQHRPPNATRQDFQKITSTFSGVYC